MARIELPYTPQPRQKLLHDSVASEILYGGAAGGGKSMSIRWDAYDFCLNNPGCVAVLVRQTLPQLEKNHIRWIRRELSKELGTYNETRKAFNWFNGSILAFQHLEYDKDINDFQGDEIHWLGIDEAALLKPEHISEIKSRLRLGSWKPTNHGLGRLPRLVMGSNPGGPSHLYLKEGWIDPAPPETVFQREVQIRGRTINKTRVFIPAKMDDNSFLDPDYDAQFADMPEWKIQQLVDGDWNVVPGAYFDCWDPRRHVVQSFEVPKWWKRYRSCDWGFRTPFSIGEWVVSDGSEVTQKDGAKVAYPSGALIRVWEWYGAAEKGHNVGLKLDASEVGSRIVERRGKCSPGPMDTSAWRADMGPSMAEKFHKAGVTFFQADRQREAGWQEMYRRINKDMLYVLDTCRHFIRTIPALMANPNDPNDVLKEGEDHVGDETRYMCMARPLTGKAPEPKRPADDGLRHSDFIDPEALYRRDPPVRTWI